MNSGEIVALLQANVDKQVRVTFDDGVVQNVIVHSVDQEGFVHSGPNGAEAMGYWTRFESVRDIELSAGV